MSGKRSKEKDIVYRLKVYLKGSKPSIWRKILVTGDTTLHYLYYIIQNAMGWEGGHLYEFKYSDRCYRDKSYGHFDTSQDDRKVTLVKLGLKEKHKITYIYDFGDCWEHIIHVEKILPRKEGEIYPRCIGGKKACPPEDCGGLYGYYGKLDAMENPAHPDHEIVFDWMDDEFDEDEFDIDAVNAMLQGLHKSHSELVSESNNNAIRLVDI